jgi:hypothetical protein
LDTLRCSVLLQLVEDSELRRRADTGLYRHLEGAGRDLFIIDVGTVEGGAVETRDFVDIAAQP